MKTGCVIVSYNVPGIVTRAVNSIKEYVDKIVIIDHSDIRNPAYKEVDKLGVKVIHTGHNGGHGPGLDKGIRMLDTDFVITMDSDTSVKDASIINDMKALMGENIYGVGLVIKRKGVDYLHPYFAMIRKEYYLKHVPFVDHGAPCHKAMSDINGKMKVLNIDMSRVYHEHRATRQRKRL